MKAFLTILCLFGFFAGISQVHVTEKKKTSIFKVREFEIYENVYDKKDTLIMIMFRNQKYSHLTDVIVTSIDKPTLKLLVDAFAELATGDYKAGEASVEFSSSIRFTKDPSVSRMFPDYYTFWYDKDLDDGYYGFYRKDVIKMKEKIYKYLTLPYTKEK